MQRAVGLLNMHVWHWTVALDEIVFRRCGRGNDICCGGLSGKEAPKARSPFHRTKQSIVK